MSFSCLVIDCGHTRTKLARCRMDGSQPLPEIVQSLAIIDEAATISWDEVECWFANDPPDTVLVTGTNLLKAERVLEQWPASLPSPRLLTDKSLLPLRVNVDFPQKVGMDRLLNAVAANAVRDADQPVVCVDTGTAITVDVIDAEGAFSGGAILPGILMGARSLNQETTTLPLIDVWQLLKTEPAVLGKNTEAAIASGLYWGHLGAVKELIARYSDLLAPAGRKPLLLLTGGAAVILAPYLPEARFEPALSLQGLALVAKWFQEHRT